jgi:uncharacterized protein (DUF4213/DUF364 family)
MVLQETIDTITELYGESLKRITIERIVIGICFTGVKLSNGYGGVTYTPFAEIYKGACDAIPLFSKQKIFLYKGMTVHEALNTVSDAPMLNTVKIIVLNALSTLFLSNCRYVIAEDCDALDIVDIDPVKKVCMVGTFIPFLERFKKIDGIQLRVIERESSSPKGNEIRYYVPDEDAQAIIPLCDTVIISGSAIENGTIDGLLSYVNRDAMVVIEGPSVSFLPDAFFRRNVNVVSGVSVTRPDKALDMLSEGMGAYNLFKARVVKKINVLGRADDCIGHEYRVAAGGG